MSELLQDEPGAILRSLARVPALVFALPGGTGRDIARFPDTDWRRCASRWQRDPEDPIGHAIIEDGLGHDTGAEVMRFETRQPDDALQSVRSRLAGIGGPADTRVSRACAVEHCPGRE